MDNFSGVHRKTRKSEFWTQGTLTSFVKSFMRSILITSAIQIWKKKISLSR